MALTGTTFTATLYVKSVTQEAEAVQYVNLVPNLDSTAQSPTDNIPPNFTFQLEITSQSDFNKFLPGDGYDLTLTKQTDNT